MFFMEGLDGKAAPDIDVELACDGDAQLKGLRSELLIWPHGVEAPL